MKSNGDMDANSDGLGAQQLFLSGTMNSIHAEIHRLRRGRGKGGGYCFSSSQPTIEDEPWKTRLR